MGFSAGPMGLKFRFRELGPDMVLFKAMSFTASKSPLVLQGVS
jgi:hypothetical protein